MIAGPDERIEEARRRWLDASAAATQAREELGRLELEAATARARAKLEAALEQGGLSPELHGELVVDAARDHGATCARASGISEVSWRSVRVAVASIVARLKTAEESACAAYNRGHQDGYAEADRDTLDAMAQPHGTPIGVALVLYREKFAALMRERAETAERERDEARAALRDLVDALSLDDGPRIEAIRRARATLERWGMR